LDDLLALADQRLELEYLVIDDRRVPSRRLNEEEWDVRWLSNDPGIHAVLADGHDGVVVDYRSGQAVVHIVSDDVAASLRQAFQEWWRCGRLTPNADGQQQPLLLHSDIASGSGSKLVALGDAWKAFANRLARHPHEIYSLPPRKFEELIAELLSRDGFDVQLTPPTRDGGRDILAAQRTAVGDHLTLVECKRYAQHRAVDVALVRALLGTVEHERATAGLLVTTSSFTGPARAFAEPVRYRLTLKDYADLTNWLGRVLRGS
jgi:hypothetical protein